MGITSVRAFVRGTSRVTLEDVLDHFDHVCKLVGSEHVGIGSDADVTTNSGGTEWSGSRVAELNHPRRIFDLAEGMVRRGYSDRSIEGMLGINFQRAIGAIFAES